VKFRATLRSGGTELNLFIKVVPPRGWRTVATFDAENDLLLEAGFYSQHLSNLQGNIVPRHYDIFTGKTKWGGTISCAVLAKFLSIYLDCRGQILRKFQRT
jgi:hypothetical protein